MAFGLELLKIFANTAKVGLPTLLAQSGAAPSQARKRVKKSVCTPCEAMARVDAAKAKVKAARAGQL